ncbi:MAG: PBP1A family penicillin-binding protein [Actinomycetota bacterium]
MGEPGEPHRDGSGPIVMTARVLVATVLSLIIVPPVAGAVAVATLVRGPLPVGELPEERRTVTAEPSVVVDASGREIGVFRGFDQTVEVTMAEIPQVLKDAVVAIEDQRFWTHDGVDFEGIARAARTNLEVGEVVQGGSTITQQFVKNVYLSGERTFERKIEEALLATEVEKRLSKEEILFGYLTSSYYGFGAYGIGAAAEIYFDKPVADLDISEAAVLAGVVQAPSRLSPFVDREAAEERRRLVLEAMWAQGLLTDEEHEREMQRRLWSLADGDPPGGPVTVLIPRAEKGAIHYPFFVDFVEAELLERLDPDQVYNGGLTIETTIDPILQDAAEAAVAERLGDSEYPVEMSAVTIDPSTGHVVAMVGGRDYEASQVNLATGGTTGFQPGSSFKPIVMAAAFEMGLSPEVVYPAPATWSMPGCSGSQCSVSNYDHAGRGNITLRSAMHASVNTVFAQLVLDVTIAETVRLARELGLDRLDPDRAYGASLALGAAESSTLEMASAYGTFANRGIRVTPTGILRVIDRDGNVLVDNRARPGTRVLDEAVADNVTDVLVGVIEDGTGTRARLDRPAAGKTGTGQDYRAAWFVGYTPDYTTAVWMGHADRLASLRGINGVRAVTGGSHPAIAWAEIMAVAHEGLEPGAFPVPAEIVPIAETADEVVHVRRPEFTQAAARRDPFELAADCGGTACARRSTPMPTVPPPITPPSTVAPDQIDGADPIPGDTGGLPTSTTSLPANTATSAASATSAPQP